MTAKKVLIVNLWGKAFKPFSNGLANKAFCNVAETFFKAKGYEIKTTNVAEGYNVDEEIGKYQWCDLIFYQSPMNWFSIPWEAKKWADEVWTAGMDGRMCTGDGRHRVSPEDGYGTGGTLTGKKYMLSLTMNAPKGAFERPEEFLLEGKSLDDLWFWFHCNQRFFGMEQLPDSTFASYDVLKNPTIENDMERLKEHLQKVVLDDILSSQVVES